MVDLALDWDVSSHSGLKIIFSALSVQRLDEPGKVNTQNWGFIFPALSRYLTNLGNTQNWVQKELYREGNL